MEQSLKRLENIFSTKYSTSINVKSNSSDIKIEFPIALDLNTEYNYELGLMWFCCFNTIFNITNKNNTFITHTTKEPKPQILRLDPGAYEVKEINTKLQEKNKNIKVEADLTNSKCILNIKADTSLRFEKDSFFHTVLGFKDNVIYKPGTHTSEDIIKISDISTINIKCNSIKSSYMNGNETNILYSFPSNTVASGYKIIERMNPPIYFPLTDKYIKQMYFQITDENDNLIDFNNETITMCLHLKQV